MNCEVRLQDDHNFMVVDYFPHSKKILITGYYQELIARESVSAETIKFHKL